MWGPAALSWNPSPGLLLNGVRSLRCQGENGEFQLRSSGWPPSFRTWNLHPPWPQGPVQSQASWAEDCLADLTCSLPLPLALLRDRTQGVSGLTLGPDPLPCPLNSMILYVLLSQGWASRSLTCCDPCHPPWPCPASVGRLPENAAAGIPGPRG